MKRYALALGLLAGCANHQKKIDEYKAAYAADTAILNRLIEPMGVEPTHGQVTLAVTRPFAEKILLSSLRPNLLTVSVAEKGRVYRAEGKKLGLKFENGVWLNQGAVGLKLNAGKLQLDGDTITLQTTVEGEGAISADLKFFGLQVSREVALAVHHDEPLNLKLVAAEGGWLMKAVGQPIHADVNVKTPALTVGATKLGELKLNRTVEVPLDKLKPYALPLPAPRAVKVGPQTFSVGLKNYQLGAHQGVLWLGADLLVGEAPGALVPPAPAPAPAPAPQPTPGQPSPAQPQPAQPQPAEPERVAPPEPSPEPLGPPAPPAQPAS